MAYNPKDYYFKKAKEKDFAARSVFKLEEIDKKYRLFRSGDKVLDLGCAPGSWCQYAVTKTGSKGLCIGIDLQKVKFSLPGAVFVQGDAFSQELLEEILAQNQIDQFDVILSDMAPKTSGIRVQDQQRSYDLCVRALEVAKVRLKPKGHFIVKFFQSGEFDHYLKTVRRLFERVEVIRPKSTRKNSYEIFIIGLKFKAS
ncbi:MAG: RlmE family RNA methyltransferase [Bacteriovoracia bacterium]